MSGQIAARQRPIARVVYDPRRRKNARSPAARTFGEYSVGEPVRSVTLIRNDGMYPHKDIGEALVLPGDIGVVRQSWRFLGDFYYTVEFVGRAVFVIMRGREMARIGTSFDPAA